MPLWRSKLNYPCELYLLIVSFFSSRAKFSSSTCMYAYNTCIIYWTDNFYQCTVLSSVWRAPVVNNWIKPKNIFSFKTETFVQFFHIWTTELNQKTSWFQYFKYFFSSSFWRTKMKSYQWHNNNNWGQMTWLIYVNLQQYK